MTQLANSFFLPYQQRWIKDRSPLKIMEKSRQVGMSWASAFALVKEQADNRTPTDSWVTSRDELQAELFIQDCANFAEILHTAARRVERALLSDERPLLAHSLRFANGRSIHALSSNPNAQAGKRGTRLLDEFALHPNPRELYTIALPGVTWGGRLEIISTHRGAGNFFNQLIIEVTQQGNPKNFSHHRVTIVDALEEGFLRKLKEKLPAGDPRQQMDEDQYLQYVRSQCADEAAFQQEYMCNPNFDDASFLPVELVMAAQSPHTLPAVVAGPLYIGVDLGRTHDRTVIFVLEDIAGKLFTRHLEVMENTPFALQEAALERWASHANCRALFIDASGLGRQFAERAAQKYGAHRAVGVSFTDDKKAQLAYELKDALERRQLTLPATAQLRSDLLSVEKTTTPTGSLKFSAPRDASGHADHFWALALAVTAARSHTSAPAHITLTPLNRELSRTRKNFL